MVMVIAILPNKWQGTAIDNIICIKYDVRKFLELFLGCMFPSQYVHASFTAMNISA